MEKVSVSSKGQVVIPKAMRRRLNLQPGTRLEVSVMNDDTLTLKVAPKLSHKEQIARLAGSLKRPGQRRISDEDMHRAVLDMAAAQDERTKTKPRRKGKRR
ncbi:MAG: AbrB/MazE/SpoVT family DNA-binding domain-containing protein [Betaproteobacteria bacterium]